MDAFKAAVHRKIFIDRKIREESYPNASSLARDYLAEFGKYVNSRTIAADLAEMRDEMGAPLHYDGEKRGYVYKNPAFTLDFLKNAPPDLKDLIYNAMAPDKKSLDRHQREALREDLRRTDPLSGKISVLSPGKADSGAPALRQTLLKALGEARELAVDYRLMEYKSASKAVKLAFRPFHLIYIESDIFVFGAVREKPGLPFALLNLAHIAGAQITGTAFPPPGHVVPELTGHGKLKIYLSENSCDTLALFRRLPRTAEPEWALCSRTELFGG
jgi:hypothetical protein